MERGLDPLTANLVVADESRTDGTTAKASDLKRRKAMADENNADIFVSIHMNKFALTKYSGLQVYYSDGNDSSKNLAGKIQSSVKEQVQPENDRVRMVLSGMWRDLAACNHLKKC